MLRNLLPKNKFQSKFFSSQKKGPAQTDPFKFGVFCVRAGLDRSNIFVITSPHVNTPIHSNAQHWTTGSARCAESVRVPVCQIISKTPIMDRHNDNMEPLQGLPVRRRYGVRKQRKPRDTRQASLPRIRMIDGTLTKLILSEEQIDYCGMWKIAEPGPVSLMVSK